MNEALLKDLCKTAGISSFEDEVSDLIKNNLDCYIEDGLKSVIYKHNNGKIKLMFASHMDEVGFIVKDIDDNGFVRVNNVGSVWSHMLLGQPVYVTLRDKKRLFGIFGSPATHGLSAEERSKTVNLNNLYLDMGVSSKQELLDMGLRIGDEVTFASEFYHMSNKDYYCCKAFDNRVACFIELETIKVLSKNIDSEVYFAFTSQEEPGLRGARSATGVVHPDVAFAIDMCLAGDTPMNTTVAKMGKGVVLSTIDSNSIAHRGLLKWVEGLCEKHHIPYQYSVFNQGGTDSGNIHKTYEGVINMTLSVPTRYMHSAYSVVNKNDIEACIKLVKVISEELTEQVFNEII